MTEQIRSYHDELRNELFIPPEIERRLIAEEESRETILDYVRVTLEGGGEPDASAFLAEYNTPGVRWEYDVVEAEIERILPTEILRKDIRDYVRRGGRDALSFSMMMRPKYDRVSGREIRRMIDEELAFLTN